MTDFCFLSVAFGPRYIEQQTRLHKSLQAIHPEAKHFAWTDALPEGSKAFSESLYGFKVHAVKHALKASYKKIIWLDPACIVVKPVYYYFTLGLPVIAAKDDNPLVNNIADKALMWYSKLSIPDNWNLVGGSLYVFDFNHPDCQKIFNTWERAEANGIFGSQQEQSTGKIDKHRNDESCMAMSLYLCGHEPQPLGICKYSNGDDSIVIKKHFK